MTTLRIILTTECNLRCEYCCNKMSCIQDQFKMRTFDEIASSNYKTYCFSGGEPVLAWNKMTRLAELIRSKNQEAEFFLYSNGLMLKVHHLKDLLDLGFGGINVGVHKNTFGNISWDSYKVIQKLCSDFGISLRFDIEDVNQKELEENAPELENVRYWIRNDCFNSVEGEDWIIC